MTWASELLSAVANVAAITTAAVAVWFFLSSRKKVRSHTLKLEGYLRDRLGMHENFATLAECGAVLGATESEVMQAAVASKVIYRRTVVPYNDGPPVVVLEHEMLR